MNERGKIGGWYSWPVIILALCIFWPAGIFLIINRVSIVKKASLESENMTNTYSAIVETKIIACPCCGANNTIVGDMGECEYCGSLLK